MHMDMRAPGRLSIVYAQPLNCQAMQWEVERFYLRVGSGFLCLTNPRGILLHIRKRQTFRSTCQKLDNQLCGILFLASCWSSWQSAKERNVIPVAFPEAVEAVRVRHLPGSISQEVERILAQPLDVAESKMYGSHAHAIPKMKEMWTTFKAEIDKAEMDKEDRLEGFRVTLFICLGVQHEEWRECWPSLSIRLENLRTINSHGCHCSGRVRSFSCLINYQQSAIHIDT